MPPNGRVRLQLRHTKNKETPKQVVLDWAKPRILDHLEQRRREGAGDLDPYLVRYDKYNKPINEPLRVGTARYQFKRFCVEAGINGRVSPHFARATAITHLLATKKLTHRQVQQFSRHKSVAMVEIYDKLLNDIEEFAGENDDF